MDKIAHALRLSNRLRLFVLSAFIFLCCYGCAGTKKIEVKTSTLPPSLPSSEPSPSPQPSPLPSLPAEKVERVERIEANDFPVPKGDDVVGRLAYVRLEKGDTLPDIARHFGLGIDAIGAANPGVDIWVPKAGERVLLPVRFILPDAPRKGIVINLAAMRLFQYKEGKPLGVSTYPIGVGTEERPSPMGQMHVARKAVRPSWYVPASIAADHRKKGDILPARVLPGPENPLGEYALYLSKPSYLIHGTNKPASIGLRATNGCIRLYPEDIKRVFETTPVKTPVTIVNQPYLLGQGNGVVYLEVHLPPEEANTAEFDKIYGRLKKMEKDSGRPLDWARVKKVLAEAKGIPVPVFETRPGSEKEIAKTVEVRHPVKLNGRPEVPEPQMEAWNVLAAEGSDETEALRMAAIINHQGPPIPARVVSANGRHRVIAGPFADMSAAKEAAKRLRFDLEIDGTLLKPVKKR